MKNDKKLTIVNFYEQACKYFFYHAEQRTKMIQYFVAVFAAALALYGTLLEKYPIASAFVALFQIVVSIVFYFIDKRNKFLVEESENVIKQIEKDNGVDVPIGKYAYGVFSNEENIYNFYNICQNKKNNKVKEISDMCDNGYCDKDIKEKFKKEFPNSGEISVFEMKKGLKGKKVLSFSRCVKWLYNICTGISVIAVIIAVLIVFKVF